MYKILFIVFTFANIFPIKCFNCPSVVNFIQSQDSEIVKNIAENWQGDFNNDLFISVVVWKIFLATAGRV